MFNYNNYSIRPIELNDKERLLQWRNSDKVRCNMYTDHIISEEEHNLWFSNALAHKPSPYLIFLYKEKPVGYISFTNITTLKEHCYMGFYLGETNIPLGLGAIMEFFVLDYAFLTLKIRKLCCEVFTFNPGVIKLHENFGFIHEGKFTEHYLKNDKYEDIACLAKFRSSWLQGREEFKMRLFGQSGD